MTSSRLQRWRPELRRALIKVRPEFFNWSVQEQERFGVELPRTQYHQRLERALLDELFGREVRSFKAASRAADRLSLDEQNRWNETILPLTGIGDDCFYLHEHFGDDKTILDCDTLLAYDEDDYHFQEDVRQKEESTYPGKPYRGSLYLTWARLFVDKQFTYATLSMAAGYIFAKMDEAAFDLINARIPHRHVPGQNHGKTKGDFRQWDLRTHANGQEALLEELQRRVFDYTGERYDSLLTAWDNSGGRGVYLVDTSEPPETNIHVVFTDKQALAAVRFRSFLRDCRAIKRAADELNHAVEQEKRKLASFVCEQHGALLRTFDPRVIPLRKNRRIMMHKDAFDDLE